MNIKEEALKLHENNKGKIAIISKVSIETKDDLSLAYTPGVAEPCREIAKNPDDVYKYTSKGNTVAVITDGSAVLGLGNIGSLASIPVMEGKSILLKRFADIDSFPICLNTQDPDEIIKTCQLLEPTLGAINLEDISAPRCVYIERKLKKTMNIPVFHDDQHGTAIVISAAIINACRLTKKSISTLDVVISGTGAAGSSIARMLKKIGVKNVYSYNITGVISQEKYASYDFLIKELLDEKIITSSDCSSLEELMIGKDCFIGVSAPNIVSKEMIKRMNPNPFVFPMANPNPEITFEDAIEAGAYIVGTGRSDYPNQINNLLAFPGIFRGALDARATDINEEMKMSASYAIANLITDEELNSKYIVPSPFDKRVVEAVSKAVKDTAIQMSICQK